MRIRSAVLISLTLLTGLFLRLYKYADTINLDTDQTAAYLVADRIITGKNPLLVGPLTSIWQANILPPTYYYIVTFLHTISRNELFIPLVFTFFNIFSIYLLFILGKTVSSAKTGLIASLLFATSESMIFYGRDFWEPYLVPFFVILSLLFLAKGTKNKQILFFHLSLFSFFLSFLYVSSILILPVYMILFYKLYSKIKGPSNLNLPKVSIMFLLYGVLTYLPVFFYELKNSYPTISFLSENLSKTPDSGFFIAAFLSSLENHIYLFVKSVFIYVGHPESLLIYISVSLLFLKLYFGKSKKAYFFKYFVMMFMGGIFFTSLYSGNAEVYRLASLYPVFFILISQIAVNLKNKLLTFILIFIFIFFNTKSAINTVTNLKMEKYRHPYKVAEKILTLSEIADFTIYTMTPQDRDNHHSTSYWYALEKLTNRQLITLNTSGNWINQDLDTDKPDVFLICRNFSVNNINADCLDYFIRKFQLTGPLNTTKIDNIYLFKFSNIKSDKKEILNFKLLGIMDLLYFNYV